MTRFKECREKKGFSQKYVALTLGVKAPSVSAWESGKTLPSSENLVAVAKLYDVSVDFLLGRETKPEKKERPVFTDIPCINRVKELCVRKDISQKELAALVGVSQPTVSEWFTNKKNPRGERLEKLSEVFGVSKAYILGYDELNLQLFGQPETEFVEDPAKPMTNEIRRQLVAKLNAMDDETLRQAASYIDFLANGGKGK